MRFISPKTDFAFKKIFGSIDSKDILISLLNALLYEGESRIQDLEIIDPYLSGNAVGLKDSYLAVKATLDSKEIVIIEMQVLNVAAFDKRVIYNAAKTYTTQLKSGEGYFKLNPVIALIITDFIMFDRHDRTVSRYRFKDVEDFGDSTNNDIELLFVELPKFKKTLEELETLSE
ncbi:MAG: Rpn family recombination-promoting nuclease/putative transposase [Cyanobacteriota bacterium]|nr:Rpn family recombination-promoting nuclease/putative transposase [Cyanobacteriota bacterium]